jgi:PhoH-like ATPase
MECDEKIKFYDTSSLLNLQELAFKDNDKFVISSITLTELENIKSSYNKDESIKYKCRELLRLLNNNQDKYDVIIFNSTINQILIDYGLDCNNDNKIIATASYYNSNIKHILFYTDDLCCKLIAKQLFSLYVKSSEDEIVIDNYTGFKDITVNDDELSYFYLHLNENIYNLLENQYLLLRHKGSKKVEKFRWDGMQHVHLNWKQLDNGFSEKIKPIGLYQEISFDLLQNPDITIKVLTGKQGSGKSYLMIAHALQQIKSGKKLMFVRNTIEVKDTKGIGFLPSGKLEKLIPFCGSLLDHCGGIDGLNKYIANETIEVEHLGFMRGRNLIDTTLYVNEAGNISTDHLQMLIGRLGKGSSLWLDGDLLQIDSKTFEIDNGLRSAINKLRGQNLFGFVQLQECIRSDTAKLADLLN